MELLNERKFTVIDGSEMSTLAFLINEPEGDSNCATIQKLDFVLNVRNGFSCFNKGGASSQYKLGLTFFNWKKIYELYQINFFDNHLNESYEPAIIIKKPVFIKKKRKIFCF